MLKFQKKINVLKSIIVYTTII